MDSALALVAALAASFFAFDLWLDYRRRPRPHIAAYGTGMTMFAIATWAFFLGITFGWTGPLYRVFYLFGAILNIPFLALGSMFLVVGKRSGHVMAIALGAFTAISTTLTATVPFANPLPETGVPHDVFASGFGPRLFAILGGAMGATILAVLSARIHRPILEEEPPHRLGQLAHPRRDTGGGLGGHRSRPRRVERFCPLAVGCGDTHLGRLSGGVGWTRCHGPSRSRPG